MKTGRHRILTHSNHKFGEPQVAKNAIVTTATLAVRSPSGTTAIPFGQPIAFSTSDISINHSISISNGFRITSDHIHVRDLSLVGSRANWVPRTAVAQKCSDCSSQAAHKAHKEQNFHNISTNWHVLRVLHTLHLRFLQSSGSSERSIPISASRQARPQLPR